MLDPESFFALTATRKKQQNSVSDLEDEHWEKTETLEIEFQRNCNRKWSDCVITSVETCQEAHVFDLSDKHVFG